MPMDLRWRSYQCHIAARSVICVLSSVFSTRFVGGRVIGFVGRVLGSLGCFGSLSSWWFISSVLRLVGSGSDRHGRIDFSATAVSVIGWAPTSILTILTVS